MDLALKEPTENSVAQAEHESQRSRVIVPDEILAQDGRFEAQAVDFGSRSQWSEAVAAAEHWQNDQPFASDPAMYLSYLASVGLEDYETAERAAQRGLVANPQNPTLANNLAFSLANLGKLEEARNTLERIPISMLDRHDVSVRQATAGLIAFRSGKLNEGRTLYRSALVDGRGDLSPEQLALAYAYWFREEARAETADAPSIGKSARQAITVARSDDARAVFNRVVLGQSGFPFAR
jgi:tetratricopeptide (TPR) repeat protein